MSISQIQRFVDLVDSDEEVRTRLKAIGPGDSAAEVISGIAQSRGIHFSAAELRLALGKNRPLTDDQLEQVAGGVVTQGGVNTGATEGALHGSTNIGGINPLNPALISAYDWIK